MSKHAMRSAKRQCRRAPGALCATSGESTDEDGEVVLLVLIREAGLVRFWVHQVLSRKGSKATSSIRHRSQVRASADGQRPIRSIAKRCFERCWRTSSAAQVRDIQGAAPEEEDRRRLRREPRHALSARRVECMDPGARVCTSFPQMGCALHLKRLARTKPAAKGVAWRLLVAILQQVPVQSLLRSADQLCHLRLDPFSVEMLSRPPQWPSRTTRRR
jgi:hypothetical protein